MSSSTLQRMNTLLQFDWSLSTIRAGTEDAKKILSNDGACPICDQVLSKRCVVGTRVNVYQFIVSIVIFLLNYITCMIHLIGTPNDIMKQAIWF